MSKIQAPVIGRSRGSAGGMTFTKMHFKNVMRAKPFKVANPKTTAQVTQRDFFAQVQDVVASVSNEQLRSLFGTMPKDMSRRNALSKQVAAAYSVNGTTKSVDFSKLQAIGNGEKVNTPLVQFVNGVSTDSDTITAQMLNVGESQNPNLIVIAFDTSNNKILVIITDCLVDENYTTSDVIGDNIVNFNGFAYITCESKGENVYDKSIGSFIIKTRKEKAGHDIQKGTPKAGDVVELEGDTLGSNVNLDFSNYNFNHLAPGDLYQEIEDNIITLISGADWVASTNTLYSANLFENYNDEYPVFLWIMQDNVKIDSVPFQVQLG